MQCVKLPQTRHGKAFASTFSLSLALMLVIGLSLPMTTKAQCTSTGNGFPSSDSLLCFVRGQSVDLYIPYTCFDGIHATYTEPLGYVFNSDRMFRLKLDSISNVPCGLSIDINSAQNPIERGQTACLHLHGTTTDTAGYYKIGIVASFDVVDLVSDGYTHTKLPLDAFVAPDHLLTLRVTDSGGTCTPEAEEAKQYNNSHCN